MWSLTLSIRVFAWKKPTFSEKIIKLKTNLSFFWIKNFFLAIHTLHFLKFCVNGFSCKNYLESISKFGCFFFRLRVESNKFIHQKSWFILNQVLLEWPANDYFFQLNVILPSMIQNDSIAVLCMVSLFFLHVLGPESNLRHQIWDDLPNLQDSLQFPH